MEWSIVPVIRKQREKLSSILINCEVCKKYIGVGKEIQAVLSLWKKDRSQMRFKRALVELNLQFDMSEVGEKDKRVIQSIRRILEEVAWAKTS